MVDSISLYMGSNCPVLHVPLKTNSRSDRQLRRNCSIGIFWSCAGW
jgi:hypothetical protein